MYFETYVFTKFIRSPFRLQAPKDVVCLFNGYRQVVYGFVPHCRMATLSAKIGDRELSTMVSTTDLNVTTGKVCVFFFCE